ncbi:ABC-2 type transport system ATP-binding protein [Mycoplasmoides fastidiosum]|uniref:ABC-2 type transport system ATP-binding protein n=1 Tax=Mycoplasmoides fastidiosum TaxID=92758 RepID=A0ABU0LZ02_9BACT|nr:ABC transporter ATP-binding protein [Mycoplasmoides fastidiosum]MDQ0513937.1 ABC-2 type transport system ATP-binding protein [Mycoplasmoides fastidiosum]UUD37649.1 ABC transporter ATP-binding protein [Mycoplasmoides fastidiosum]
MNHQYILEVNHLNKIYSRREKTGIFDVNFKVDHGSFHAFIGENGAGKTTTIKSIINSYTNWTGQIFIDGISNKLAISKSKIGYVPEYAHFPKEVSVLDYLLSLGLLSGMKKKDALNRINELLAILQITDLKKKKPYNFSSGQKKKVLLIQALMHNPEIIILDEPAANLDPTARHELFKLLVDLKKVGKTIFISSHILREVDGYCDSLTLMHKGRVVYSGKKYKSLEEIYNEKIL